MIGLNIGVIFKEVTCLFIYCDFHLDHTTVTPASVPKMMTMVTSVEEKLFPEGIIMIWKNK